MSRENALLPSPAAGQPGSRPHLGPHLSPATAPSLRFSFSYHGPEETRDIKQSLTTQTSELTKRTCLPWTWPQPGASFQPRVPQQQDQDDKKVHWGYFLSGSEDADRCPAEGVEVQRDA